ncbi:helix-turn-helix domain-containing protein [Streptacidiphilus jiangxiensis]|uniref:Helix-turn-helix domain-containing protein n=1 Tax=Streptacidiphilus jiangxiensis TaxID=235985 RepID=A0A1H7T762_STRJI|nr:helix-turn-helix transcriptional regulator [Streptacidiphilus jiangxiensis]SEL80710.1 Helix-turn-helix domain-containing protein [Streptacidiphilus jiangxiensis]
MTDFQREREALGAWLHRLRRDAGLNGKELAQRLGWAPSKVSRIEHGRQTPTAADLEAWAQACGEPDAAAELSARLQALDSHYVTWRRSLRAGHAPRQRVGMELDRATTVLRVFEPGMVPGLLQTAEYARALFTGLVSLQGTPDDVPQAVEARMERQRVLYHAGHEFHFVLTESALRARLCAADAHRGQLDRLLAVGSLPGVRLGLVPDSAPLPLAPLHSFWIFDDRLVQVETWTAEVNVTEPAEIALYRKVFDRYVAVARYGSAARHLLTSVMAGIAQADEMIDASVPPQLGRDSQ